MTSLSRSNMLLASAKAGIALLFLVGCESPGPTPQSYAPRVFYPTGEYSHEYTKLRFPEQLAGFERLHVTGYDPSSANISAHYGEASLRIAATVYHYPANAEATPPSKEEFLTHFDQTMNDVLVGNPGATLLDSGGVTAAINGFELPGAHAQFRTPGHPGFAGEADSHLYLFALDGWYLKFRFSHPENSASVAVPKEAAFITSIEWPTP